MSAETEITRHHGGGSPSRRLDGVIAELVVSTGVSSVSPARPARRARWMAAVLATGPGAVLSGRSAAALHGMRPDEGCEVIALRDRRPRGIRVHRARIAPDEVTTVDGIPVTGISRTLFDLAAVLSGDQLRRAARRAEIDRLTDAVSLTELLTRYPRRRDTRRIRELLADGTLGSETRSELEDRFLDFVRRHDLPPSHINVHLHGFTGAFTPTGRPSTTTGGETGFCSARGGARCA